MTEQSIHVGITRKGIRQPDGTTTEITINWSGIPPTAGEGLLSQMIIPTSEAISTILSEIDSRARSIVQPRAPIEFDLHHAASHVDQETGESSGPIPDEIMKLAEEFGKEFCANVEPEISSEPEQVHEVAELIPDDQAIAEEVVGAMPSDAEGLTGRATPEQIAWMDEQIEDQRKSMLAQLEAIQSAPAIRTDIPREEDISTSRMVFGREIPEPPIEWWSEPITQVGGEGGGGQMKALNSGLSAAGFKEKMRHRAIEAVLTQWNGDERKSVRSLHEINKAEAHICLTLLEYQQTDMGAKWFATKDVWQAAVNQIIGAPALKLETEEIDWDSPEPTYTTTGKNGLALISNVEPEIEPEQEPEPEKVSNVYSSQGFPLSECQAKAIEDTVKVVEAREGGFVFITGKAGTGKSVCRTELRRRINCVVCAPTGMVALEAKGMTIHALFGFGRKPKMKSTVGAPNGINADVLSECDAILIDEVSMVRADIMDAINWSLQKLMRNELPFGGKTIVGIGDLWQLPPVVTDSDQDQMKKYKSPFFFDAEVFNQAQASLTSEPLQITRFELDHVFRQTGNPEFVDALNKIRVGDVSGITYLNQRAGIKPPKDEMPVSIAFTNRQTETTNHDRLESLPGEEHTFDASITGEFDIKEYPAPETLRIKEGAQVMFTKNLPTEDGERVSNGMIGEVESIETIKVTDWQKDPDGNLIMVKTEQKAIKVRVGSRLITVKREEWEQERYVIDIATDKIESQVTGTFRQYPLKLAWSITSHKCVPISSLVFKKDKGYVPIKSLELGDLIQSGDGTFQRILDKSPIQDREAVTVKTLTGLEPRYSKDHRVLACRDGQFPNYVKASELKPGDFLCRDRSLINSDDPVLTCGDPLERRAQRQIQLPNRMDRDLAYILGIIVGDGCTTDKRAGRIDVTCGDREPIEAFKRFCKTIGINSREVPHGNGWTCYAHSRELRSFLMKLGLGYELGPQKKAPSIIWKSSATSRAMFLRGLFDTDGGADRRRQVRFTTSSKQLAKDVSLLLQGLGVISSIQTAGPKHFKVCVLTSSIEQFQKEVGFQIARKQEILAGITTPRIKKGKTERDFIPFKDLVLDSHTSTQIYKGKKINYIWRTPCRLTYRHASQIKPSGEAAEWIGRHYFYDEIVSIEDSGSEPMIDIEVENSHTFVCEGFVTHNSQGQTLESAVLDLERPAFAHGQLYVALSRVKSIEGLYLRRKLTSADVIIDKNVQAFFGISTEPAFSLALANS